MTVLTTNFLVAIKCIFIQIYNSLFAVLGNFCKSFYNWKYVIRFLVIHFVKNLNGSDKRVFI